MTPMLTENTIDRESFAGSREERVFIAALILYYAASVLLRIAVSSTADMDETEQLVLTQALHLGYGSQPPLYAWIQSLYFSLFGVNIFALSFLKFTLLFSTFLCVLQVARKTLQDSRAALCATASLFLVPQVVWESYRTLTNTVLATLMAALTLLMLLRLRENPSTANYLLFGAAAGLGMLSKFNYLIFFLALVTAGMMTPSFRRVLKSGKGAVSLAVMAVITAPPYLWILTNLDRAMSSTKKLKAMGGNTYLIDAATGIITLIIAWIGYIWPALIVYAFLYFRFKPVRETSPDTDIHKLLSRTLGVILAACLIMVFFFQVTYFKERWMQPLLFFMPVFFMHFLGSRLDSRRFHGLLAVTLIPALLAPLVFSGGVILASKTGRVTRQSPPYKAFAEGIRGAGFERGTIITNDHRIGGNFRLHFKNSPVLVTRMVEVPFSSGEPALILWKADKNEKPPEPLEVFAGRLLNLTLDGADIRYLEEPMLYWEDKTMKLGYIIIEAKVQQQ